MTTLVPSGYTLTRFEVLNWGTFNGLWSLNPNGKTSLLTGKNGTGKSTLVDALLTLLVPNQKRNYNQASGDKRRERREMTYVRGAYSRLRDDTGQDQVQYLRAEGSYSVLLAVFERADGGTPVSIASVFGYREGNITKFFVLAQRALSIMDNFQVGEGGFASLKRDLRGVDARIFDQFHEYITEFRRAVGLKAANALDLFNQIVSIKEIGSLNQFVREHMLERTDMADKLDELRTGVADLEQAYATIEKAEKMLRVAAAHR